MRKELFVNFVLAALMMLASAVLSAKKDPVRLPAPSSLTPAPFGCTLPPGVNAAEAGCNP